MTAAPTTVRAPANRRSRGVSTSTPVCSASSPIDTDLPLPAEPDLPDQQDGHQAERQSDRDGTTIPARAGCPRPAAAPAGSPRVRRASRAARPSGRSTIDEQDQDERRHEQRLVRPDRQRDRDELLPARPGGRARGRRSPARSAATPPVASLGTASGTPSTKYGPRPRRRRRCSASGTTRQHSAIAAPTASVTAIIVTKAASW